MRIKIINNSAFSLLEILMAAIIFIVSVAGIFATLNAVRGPVIAKENQLAASVFGKQVLEALYSQVTAGGTFYTACATAGNPCPNFDLSVGIHQVPSGNLPSNVTWPTALTAQVNGVYPNGNPPVLNYTVSCAGSGNTTDPSCGGNPASAHQVTLNINWSSAT